MLEFTGERFIPGAGSDELHHEHVHRYRFTAGLADGRRVLDLGSGEGYGSAILAERAASVTGIDLDAETVGHATRRYGASITFLTAPATAVPLPDDSVDLVACFEVIEHVDDPGALLDEVTRVLAPGGLLVCSTPDRETYNAGLSQPNPFHVSELSRDEFAALLGARFAGVRLYGQRSVTASWLAAEAPPDRLELGGSDAPLPDPVFWVAVAALDGEAPEPAGSVLVDPGRQQSPEHADLLSQVRGAQIQLAKYERHLQELAAALRAADERARTAGQ